MRLPSRTHISYPLIVLGVGFLVRAGLVALYPAVFGSDSITRLVNRDVILLAHQLPALQISISWISKVSMEPALVRYWMAALGAVAGLGFYLLAANFLSPSDAFWDALFLATNPLIVAYSTVPYQEIVMLGALSFAFHYFFTAKWAASSLALALACFSRYEAWAACPVLAIAYGLGRHRRLRRFLSGALLFGWAPVLWILFNGGLAPGGTTVAESSVSLARLQRYAYIGWITVKNTPVPVLCLAILGLWGIWKGDLGKKGPLLTLGAFLGLFLLAILFSAHGDPRDPERFVTAREAHLPIAGAILMAGIGLRSAGKLRLPLAVAAVALGVVGAGRFVAQATSEPEVQVSYRVAQYLDRALGPHDRALLLAKPVPRELMQGYLDRAFREHGEMGRRNAQRVLDSIETSPPDYQRTLVHSRLGRDRLLHAVHPERPPEWVVVWSDFQPADEAEARFYKWVVEDGSLAETVAAGPLSARIYRTGLRRSQ